MKKIYCKPSVVTVKVNSSSFICTSTLDVKSESYNGETMTDLAREARFSSWDEEDE
jgi:hypothetical protein